MLRLIVSFALLFSVTWASARPLSFEDCAREAAEHNPAIASAQAGVQSAEAQVKGAYGNFLPQLSASASALRGNFSSSLGGVPATGATNVAPAGDARNNYSVGLSATEPLFSGFRDVGRVGQAKANAEVARASLALVKAQVGASLKTAFAELLFAEELQELARAIAERSRQNVRLVKLRYEGGRENKGSYLLSLAELAQAEYQIEHAERDRHVAEKQLAQALGRADASDLQVTGKLELSAPPEAPDLRALALASPAHHQAMQQAVAAQAGTEIARAQLLPELDLVGSETEQGQNQFPNSNHWYVGLSLTYPFFNGGQSLFGLQSAQAAERQAELTRTSTEQSLLAQLEQAYAALKDAVGQKNVAERFLEAAQSRATIARGKYSTGLMTFEDWDIIENDLITRETNALNAKKNAVVAEAAWEQAQGKGAIP